MSEVHKVFFCQIMNGKKTLSRSKLIFIWFEKLIRLFRRVKAISNRMNLTVSREINGDHD